MKNKILVLGANGMAGHLIATFLNENNYIVETTTRSLPKLKEFTNYIWSGDFSKLEEIIFKNDYTAIVNCIGILGTECDKHTDSTVLINSYLPHFLVNVTSKMKTKIIHLSTDCVFSGKKGDYTEFDVPDGETFYDRSKALGEFFNDKDVVFRNSIIGPDMNVNGVGLFNWFIKSSGPILGYDNWIWSGITTLELAKKIDIAIKHDLHGLFHLTNNQKISKYELLQIINEKFNMGIAINKSQISNRIDKSLIDTKQNALLSIPSYDEMVCDLLHWIGNRHSLYNHIKVSK